jgi:dGTPase
LIHDDIRERIEAGEERFSPLAAKSRFSRGRRVPEEPSPMRTDFQRDRDRIVHCKAFRRLKHKTQVFLAPVGDHYVVRLTHTLQVAQIARSIARALNLNEDLTEAIVLGHDLGHPPFGHAGEEALDEIHAGGFHHSEQSLRVVDVLEKDGRGLNLTWEVRDGILKHSKARESIGAQAFGVAFTLEGQIGKLADSVAYLNHDIGDAIRAGLLGEGDLPAASVAVLGHRHSERINTMVCDIIDHSWEQVRAGEDSGGQTRERHEALRSEVADLALQNRPLVGMSARVLEAVDLLREYLFRTVYAQPSADGEMVKAKQAVQVLYRHFSEHSEQLPLEFRAYLATEPIERVVCDYVSGMTDRYALKVFSELCMPQIWSKPE